MVVGVAPLQAATVGAGIAVVVEAEEAIAAAVEVAAVVRVTGTPDTSRGEVIPFIHKGEVESSPRLFLFFRCWHSLELCSGGQ